MVRHVFEPLAMSRTVLSETEGVDGVTSLSPRSVFGKRFGVEEARRPDYSCLAGAGAFLSTPTDLVRLGSAALKPGLLKAETIAALRTPTRLVSGTSTTYALGWTVRGTLVAGKAVRIVSHRGSPWGGSVSLLTFPDLGLAIAAAANVTDASGVYPFALQVADAFARKDSR
jgi:serine beta-lactamase-like protein LACTB, mitochondrial